MSQWYFQPVGSYWFVGTIALALVVALAFVGIPAGRLARRRRAALTGIRVTVLALLILALLRPALVHTEVKKQSATLVVLADRSRSMMVADSFGGKSRWDVLRNTLADALPTLRTLSRDIEIKVYTFDADLESVDFSHQRLDLGSKADGKQTAIGAALEGVLRRESGKRLAAVILLSDGAQRAYAPRDVPPQNAARRLADLGYPLYTVTLGQSRDVGQARDIAIKDLIANPSVYVKNELVVQGSARIDGFAGQKVPVQLLVESPGGKMEIAATQQLESQDGRTVPFTLSTVPQMPGEYKVALSAVKQPGELVTTNNQLSTFVTVLKGGINVLYLEGELRVEQKFLRRALDASPDIKLDYVHLDASDRKGRPSDLAQRFGKYDVYILGDLDSSLLTKDELAALTQAVKQGAGLIMLGGYHSFGPGGYSDTPLAEVLPIRMAANERQRPGDALRTDMHLKGPLKMRPSSPLGTRHFVMALSAGAANAQAWDSLPPLEGANRLDDLKPSAAVLAETTAGKPLLVAHEAGGRVMAFAGDSTWHWWMQGREAAHKRFWRQVILWLARKDDVSDGNVWIKLAQRRFAPGSQVEFTVGAQSAHGESVANANFQVEILLPDKNKQPLRVIQQRDSAVGTFSDTQTAGDYTLLVTATGPDGTPLGTTKSRFLVFDQDLELDNAGADPTLLSSLSAMTKDVGGQTLVPEELPQLLKRIEQKPLELDVQTEVKETPWDTWPFFLAFVGLLSSEWYLRKKWGLV